MRVHDLRGTFVTLSLANGKTETWVADRTGHSSSVMINRYRRTARTTAELGVGNLLPLDEAIPEFKPKKGEGGEAKGESERTLPNMSDVSVDFASSIIHAVPEKGLEPSRGVASADFETIMGTYEGPETPRTPGKLHVGVHGNAGSHHLVIAPEPAMAELAQVLIEALALAAKHGEWELVSRLTKQLGSMEASSFTVVKGGLWPSNPKK